jgi:hypothetical protein
VRGEGRGKTVDSCLPSPLTPRHSSLAPAAPSEPIRRCQTPVRRGLNTDRLRSVLSTPALKRLQEKRRESTAFVPGLTAEPPHPRARRGAPVPPNGLRCPVRRSQRRRRRPRVNSFLECGGGQIQDASGFVKIAKGLRACRWNEAGAVGRFTEPSGRFTKPSYSACLHSEAYLTTTDETTKGNAGHHGQALLAFYAAAQKRRRP